MSLVTLAVLGVLLVMAAAAAALVRRWPLAGIVTLMLVIAFVLIWVIGPTPW